MTLVQSYRDSTAPRLDTTTHNMVAEGHSNGSIEVERPNLSFNVWTFYHKTEVTK